MKDIRRSRRLRLPRRRQQLTKPMTSEDEESDLEHKTIQKHSLVRSNQNANRMPTALFDTIPTLPIEEKQYQTLLSASDQSSLCLYSINSLQKPAAISDDLTSLTSTTTNITPLTALTYSNTKQTETITTVKIDLTQLSGTDTLDSDHDQSSILHLSLGRKISSANMRNLTQIYDTDTSMKSVVFTKENSLSFQKHASCFTIPGVGNGDSMIITSPLVLPTNVNTCQRSSVRWNFLQNMTNKLKLLIGCSSLGLIAGIVVLMIIL